jgi:hypothetical protein
LERGWPREFAPVYREIVPPPAPDEKKKIGVPFFLDTGGKSIEELTAFPISGNLSPPQDRPAPD